VGEKKHGSSKGRDEVGRGSKLKKAAKSGTTLDGESNRRPPTTPGKRSTVAVEEGSDGSDNLPTLATRVGTPEGWGSGDGTADSAEMLPIVKAKHPKTAKNAKAKKSNTSAPVEYHGMRNILAFKFELKFG
jgi:hypothetical protein